MKLNKNLKKIKVFFIQILISISIFGWVDIILDVLSDGKIQFIHSFLDVFFK